MNVVDIIAAKRDGHELSSEQIGWLINGAMEGSVADYQLSAWLMAVVLKGMSDRETADLTRSLVASGKRLDLSSLGGFVGDKHSTGGVGDKTTLVVAPLVAAAGVPMGKMSGRGLGYSGGTIDKLESIPGMQCSLTVDQFIEGVRNVGLVVAAQTPDLAPADGILYKMRDVTATVDSLPLIASSIMSKKIAAGANGVVLDVKVGSGAFMKTPDQARALAISMRDIGRGVGLLVRAVLSDMDQPLGWAVGNNLEVHEAVQTLRGEGPADLLEVALVIGGNLLEMAGKANSVEAGQDILRETLRSGAGLEKLREFVMNQGGDPSFIDDPHALPSAPVQRDLVARTSGWIAHIDAEAIGRASVEIGAGRRVKSDAIDHRVGFVLNAKIGDHVETGSKLATIHTSSDQAASQVEPAILNAFTISATPVAIPPVIMEVIA
ncbi:MAG TPA: thymidine phosphorylase [Chloroflexia bacterium]|nr:thymidine phosphorylase [Chloroflexia bacterium]